MEKWATADAFFKCPVPREKVTVPGLGDIWVYGLTNEEKDEYENQVMQFSASDRQVRMRNARAMLLLLAVRNQHGSRMFGEKDMGRLKLIPVKITDPILDVVRRLSGMGANEIKDLIKNSQTLQELLSADSGSGSPDILDGANAESETKSAPVS